MSRILHLPPGRPDTPTAADLAPMPAGAPPHNPDAEVAVLGACLLDADAVRAIRTTLAPADLYRDGHRHLLAAIYAVADRGEVPDPVTVGAALEAAGTLEQAGGRDFLGWLLDAVPTAANVAYHAKLVQDAARRRSLGTTLAQYAAAAWEPGVDVSELAAEAVQRILPAATTAAARGFVDGRALVWDAMEEIERRRNGERGQIVPLGFPELDEAPVHGVEVGDLVTLLLVSGHGKTALQLSMGRWAGERGIAWAFVSAEMAGRQLVNRLLAGYSGIDFGRLRKGIVYGSEQAALAEAAVKVAALPFHVDDTPCPTLRDVQVRVRALKAANPALRLVFVDYIQLLRSDAEMRASQIAEATNGLKALARECGVVVVQAAQPDARQVDRRDDDDKMPKADDVMWGQDIRFASDLVVSGYRPGKYDKLGDDTTMLCRVTKSRASGDVDFTLKWSGPTMLCWSPQQRAPYLTDGPSPVRSAHPERAARSGEEAA